MTGMPAEAATWVREHAWTDHLRAHAEACGLDEVLMCACQWGTTDECRAGRCGRCPRRDGGRAFAEDYISRADGYLARWSVSPFVHAVDRPTSMERAAPVWLADRTCVWRCGCHCHRNAAPAIRQANAVAGTQLDLFDNAT
jgi:hypothetical protein